MKINFKQVIIYIFILLIGIVIGASVMRNAMTKGSTPKQIYQKTEADIVTQNFYNWYRLCMVDYSAEKCSLNNRKEVFTDNYFEKIQQGKGDILCAQNIPLKLSYENAELNPNGTADVVVHTHWGGTKIVHNIYVFLRNINNQWKIDDISCN
jgi:hypothetical protein